MTIVKIKFEPSSNVTSSNLPSYSGAVKSKVGITKYFHF